MQPQYIILTILVSYLLGSIPFGVIFAKLFKGIDLMNFGSGNIGTSNAFRALGPVGGSLVFLCDTCKGFLPIFILTHIAADTPNIAIIGIAAGLFTIAGHNWSIFLHFKGGKGVATSFGVFLGIHPLSALLSFAIWGIVTFTTRISSIGSMSGATALPIFMLIFKQPIPYVIFSFVAFALVIFLHRANIKRILNGTELKMSTNEKKNVSTNLT